MESEISPCGVCCADCEKFGNACSGCRQISGKVFWLEYTGGTVCDIYNCCVNTKQYENCSFCSGLPCRYWDLQDPTKTDEENRKIQELQLERLRAGRGNDGKN